MVRPAETTAIAKDVDISTVKREMDAWIRSLRQDLTAVADQSDDVEDEIRKQGEEIKFNYENISDMGERLDRLEESMDRLTDLLNSANSAKVTSMRPLRPR